MTFSPAQGQTRPFPSFAVFLLFLLLLAGCGGGNGAAPGNTTPPLAFPTITLTRIASGFVEPVHVTHAGDGSGRLFVVERSGVIRIIKGGAVLPTPFVDISGQVKSTGGEQGLLSVAFPRISLPSTTWENNLLLDTTLQISSFGEDEEGNLYLADLGAGDIYRIDLP